MGPPPRCVEKTLGVARALLAQAVAVFALNGLPDAGKRSIIQVGAAAVVGLLGPPPIACNWSVSLVLGKESELLLKRHVQAPQADIVRPALDQNRRELLRP